MQRDFFKTLNWIAEHICQDEILSSKMQFQALIVEDFQVHRKGSRVVKYQMEIDDLKHPSRRFKFHLVSPNSKAQITMLISLKQIRSWKNENL